MISHFCAMCYAQFDKLKREIEDLDTLKKPDAVLSDEEKQYFEQTVFSPLDGALRRLKINEVDETFMLTVVSFRARLSKDNPLTRSALREMLINIYQTFYTKLSDFKFAFVPPPNDKYFQNDNLFGSKVYDIFPEAREDIEDAGNCFALDLHTACVFHCMRVAEFGMRRLAVTLNATLKDKGKVIPLEFGDWNKVITEINNEISDRVEAARKLANDSAKDELLKRYQHAADRIERMKDVWRNDICHTRSRADHLVSRMAFERVRDLMQFLGDTLGYQW